VLCEVFTAEEIHGVGNKGSRDTTVVDVDTLGGLFKCVPEICLFH
jgi:hypothetical protein